MLKNKFKKNEEGKNLMWNVVRQKRYHLPPAFAFTGGSRRKR
jgi:hypothetical protein